jgi:hypothetical protein
VSGNTNAAGDLSVVGGDVAISGVQTTTNSRNITITPRAAYSGAGRLSSAGNITIQGGTTVDPTGPMQAVSNVVLRGSGKITTATGGTLKIFDIAAPTFFGNTVYDSGTGRLVVLPQGVSPEFVAYLSDIPQVYQAQYYNSVDQNLTSGNTDLTFDSTQPWNNTGGYITHVPGSADFTVVQAGVYQLEFNTLILANGAVTTGNASVGFDITRTGPEIAVIRNTAGLIASAQNYAQAVAASYYLEAGDVINVRVANTFTLGPPAAAGVTGTFDYNTFFTWTFVK